MNRLALLFFLLCTAPEIACASDPYVEIYDQVLSRVAKHNRTNKIAIYYRPVRPEQLVLQRVGRHDPNRQISRAIPSVTAELEYELLFRTVESYRYDSSEPYSWLTWTNPKGQFFGTVGENDFARIEGVTTIQLGEVAFNSTQTTALVYVESSWIHDGRTSSAQGYAFLFTKTEKRWQLSEFSPLWSGGEPFLRDYIDY
jgi:hypothetical protein